MRSDLYIGMAIMAIYIYTLYNLYIYILYIYICIYIMVIIDVTIGFMYTVSLISFSLMSSCMIHP